MLTTGHQSCKTVGQASHSSTPPSQRQQILCPKFADKLTNNFVPFDLRHPKENSFVSKVPISPSCSHNTNRLLSRFSESRLFEGPFRPSRCTVFKVISTSVQNSDPAVVTFRVSVETQAIFIQVFSDSTAVAQSVYRLATGWMVRGSNPSGSKVFRQRPDRPWGPPNLL
jgi:hypothetical protein